MSKLNNVRAKGLLSLCIVVGVLFCDQLIKVIVKTTMYRGESIHIFDWFQIYFTENKGMAFGWDFVGTFFLASFRLVAVAFLIYYLVRSIKRNVSVGLVVCLSLILSGAAGNIFDNVFYGLIFEDSTMGSVAHFVPFGYGYAGFLQGHVVDMFYFPIIDTYLPSWLGGDHFVFFSPIFNLADAAISCGGVALLLFYHKYLGINNKEDEVLNTSSSEEQKDEFPPQKTAVVEPKA